MRRRIKREVTNSEYISVIQELIAMGGEFFIVKVLNNNGGYLVQCDVPDSSIGIGNTGVKPSSVHAQ
jgi:hypothetical protein